MTENKRKARFIKPPNRLKQKIGSGGVDLKLIDKAQRVIEDSEIDFKTYALDIFEKIDQTLLDFRKKPSEAAKNDIAIHYMQLKANGGMFKHKLVSDVANVALQFLDSIENLNEDAFKILDLNKKTLQIIIENDLKGTGGAEGAKLVKELDSACKRYFTKYEQKTS